MSVITHRTAYTEEFNKDEQSTTYLLNRCQTLILTVSQCFITAIEHPEKGCSFFMVKKPY